MKVAVRQALPTAAPGTRKPAVQAKLRIGPVDDPFEREADRVADQVLRTPVPEVSVSAAPLQIGRVCETCEKEEEEKLQKKEAGPQAATNEAPATVHEVLRSPGEPLDDATRAYFEPRFGRDFSGVRVHTGAVAEQSVRDVNAWAYTVGHDIAFGAGRFAPNTRQGRSLFAHELTHVVQQSGEACGKKPMPGPQTKLSMSEPGDRYEQEADQVAETVMRIDPATSRRATSGPQAEALLQEKPLCDPITPLVQRETSAEEEDDEDEEVMLQRYSASKPADVSLQSRPRIMRLTPERFQKRLGRTDEQKKVVDALFRNKEFKKYWDWLGACGSEGAHGPIKLRVRRSWEDGVQEFGVVGWGRGTLTINPWKREAIANAQELVDSIVHELFHAIDWAVSEGKCPEKEPPLPKKEPPLKEFGFRGGHPDLMHVKGSDTEIDLLETAGPSASDPCRGFFDLREAPQQAVLRIVSETMERTGVGTATRTRVNEILRQDIRKARKRGAKHYPEFLEQAPVLAKFIACRDKACFKEPCAIGEEGMQCPLRPRRNRERDIETCFQKVLKAKQQAAPDTSSSEGGLKRNPGGTIESVTPYVD